MLIGIAFLVCFFPNEPQQGDYICRYTDAEKGQMIQIQVIHAEAPNQPRYELIVQRTAPDGSPLPKSEAVKLDNAGKAAKLEAFTHALPLELPSPERALYYSGVTLDGDFSARKDRPADEWRWSATYIFGGDGSWAYDQSLVKICWDPAVDAMCYLLIQPFPTAP